MARSLIGKDQLNQTDMNQIIGEYGSGYFITKAGIESLLSTGNFNVTVTANLTGSNVVYTTGTQTISGEKTFNIRPKVNGTGVLLQGEATQGTIPSNIVYTTGTQTIDGNKTFSSRPQVNGTGVLLQGEAAQGTLPSNLVYTSGDQTISGNKTFSERIILTKDKGIGFIGTGSGDFYGIYTLSTNGGGYTGPSNQTGISIYLGGIEKLRILRNGHIALDDFSSMPLSTDNPNYKVVHMASNTMYGNTMFSMASRALHTVFFGNNSGQFILGTEAKGTYSPSDPRAVVWSGNRPYGWLFKSNLEYVNSDTFNGGNTVFFVDGSSGLLSGIGSFIDRSGIISLDWNNRRLSGNWSAQNLTINNNTFATQNSLLTQKSYAYLGSFFTPNHGSAIGDRWFITASNNGYDWDIIDINITGQEPVSPRELRDPSIIKLNNKWYVAFTQHAWKNWPENYPINSGYFMLAESTDLTNWNYRQVSLVNHFAQSGINDITTLWGPEWFQEDNGDVYLSFTIARTGWVDAFGGYQVNGLTPWIIKTTNNNLTGWTGLTRITGTGPFGHMPNAQPSIDPNNRVYSGVNDLSIVKVSGLYYTPFVDAGVGDVALGVSNNLFTGWRRITGSVTNASKSWFGTTYNQSTNTVLPVDPRPYGFEGINLRYFNGKWRAWIFDASASYSGIYCEGSTPSGLEVVSLIKSPPWRFDHGTVIQFNNYQGLLNQYDDQTISGLKTFSQIPKVNDKDILTKADPVFYIDKHPSVVSASYPYLGTFFAYANSPMTGLVVVGSKDSINWEVLYNRPYGPKADNELRDPSIIKIGDQWSIVFTEDAWGGSVSTPRNSGYFGLLQSTDLINWNYRRIDITQQLLAVNNGQNIVSKIWGPEWFREDNGDLYVNFTVMKTGWEYKLCDPPSSNYGRGLTPWIIRATDTNLTGWTGLTRITGSAFPHLPDDRPSCPYLFTSGFNDHCITKVSGLYYCLFVDQQFQQTRLATSTNLFTGWTLVPSAVGNWYGNNFPYAAFPNNAYKEGGSLKYFNGKWRLWIFDELAANSGIYCEGLTPTTMSFVSLIKSPGVRLDHGSTIQNPDYNLLNQGDTQIISGLKTFTEPVVISQNKGVGLYDRSNQFYGIYGLSSGANQPTASVTGLSVYLGGQEKIRLYNNGHVAFDDLAFMPGAANNPMYKVIHFASNLERSATIFSMASKALHTVFFGNNTGQFVLGMEGRPGSWGTLFPNGRQFGWLFKSNLDYMGQNPFESASVTQFFIDADNGNLSGRGNFIDNTGTTSLDWNNRVLTGLWKIGRTSLNSNGGVLHLAGGISFPATQVTSSDANTLDDYEEYNANSIFNIAQDDAQGTYTLTQSGIYTKIGNVMYIQGKIQVASASKVGTVGMRLVGSSTSVFPNANNSTNVPENFITFDHWASLANGVFSIYGVIPKGQNYIELYKVNALSTSSNGSRLTNQDINVGTQLGFQGFYFV